MANGHVRPGQSVTWRNETGAPVRSGALVPFGGGIAAKALQDIPAGAEGVVTLFQVHRFPIPEGLTFAPGDRVYASGGQIAMSGDTLGIYLRTDEGGWAEVMIMPIPGGGATPQPAPSVQIVKVAGATANVVVPGNGRLNVQPTFTDLPDGYEVVAIKAIRLSGGYEKTAIQSFGTAGGGTKANVSIINTGVDDATIKVACDAIAVKF